jgi:hypothetical protein
MTTLSFYLVGQTKQVGLSSQLPFSFNSDVDVVVLNGIHEGLYASKKKKSFKRLSILLYLG